MRQILLQNGTAILLQNATEVYCKLRQVSYYKMRQFITKSRRFHYKMRQLLQNATFIANCGSTSATNDSIKSFKLKAQKWIP